MGGRGLNPLARMNVPGTGAADPTAANSGHRARLRQRLFAGEGEGLLDHELIEYLLALAIPRRDTKLLARALLERFGGIGGVLTADAAALLNVPGMGETSVAALRIAHATALRMLAARVAEQPVLSNWQALIDYLHADMAHQVIERVRVLHLKQARTYVGRRKAWLQGRSRLARIAFRSDTSASLTLHSA